MIRLFWFFLLVSGCDFVIINEDYKIGDHLMGGTDSGFDFVGDGAPVPAHLPDRFQRCDLDGVPNFVQICDYYDADGVIASPPPGAPAPPPNRLTANVEQCQGGEFPVRIAECESCDQPLEGVDVLAELVAALRQAPVCQNPKIAHLAPACSTHLPAIPSNFCARETQICATPWKPKHRCLRGNWQIICLCTP